MMRGVDPARATSEDGSMTLNSEQEQEVVALCAQATPTRRDKHPSSPSAL